MFLFAGLSKVIVLNIDAVLFTPLWSVKLTSCQLRRWDWMSCMCGFARVCMTHWWWASRELLLCFAKPTPQAVRVSKHRSQEKDTIARRRSWITVPLVDSNAGTRYLSCILLAIIDIRCLLRCCWQRTHYINTKHQLHMTSCSCINYTLLFLSNGHLNLLEGHNNISTLKSLEGFPRNIGTLLPIRQANRKKHCVLLYVCIC